MPNHTANDLRRFAEAADGTRDKELFFVIENGSFKQVERAPESGEYLTVKTEWKTGGLRGTNKLQIVGGEILDKADAAFTSQSSLEKFVLPYYARSRSINELMVSMGKFYADDVICVYHEPGSDSRAVSRFHTLTAGGVNEII